MIKFNKFHEPHKNDYGEKLKGLSLLLFLVILLALPKSVVAGGAPWERKLPFKSATIQYAISGMQEGTETLYIRDQGKERARYQKTVSKMMGMEITESTVELIFPDYIYSYDLQNNEGTKSVNPQKYMIEEYEKLSAAEKKKVRINAQKMGAASLAAMGAEGIDGKLQQNAAEMLGYSCDRMEMMANGFIYLIHDTDIPLKSEVDMMGMKLSIVATSLKKGDVEEKFFQHPAGISAEVDEEVDAMAQEMAKQIIANLNDPDNAAKAGGQAIGLPGKSGGMSEEDRQMLEQVQKMMQQMKGLPEQ